MKLQVKLLSIVLILIVTPTVVLGTIAFMELHRHTIRHLIDEAITVSRQASTHIQSRLQAAEASTRLFAGAFLVERYLMTGDQGERYNLILPSLLDLFATFQQTYPEFLEIRVALSDGSVDARLIAPDVPNPIGDDVITRTLVTAAGTGGAVHARIVRDADGRARLLCVQPISLRDRTVSPLTARATLRGYMVTTVDLSFIGTVVADTRIGRQGQLDIVDGDGRSLLVDPAGGSIEPWSVDAGLMDRLRVMASSGGSLAAHYRGRDVVMGSELPRPDLMVVWTVPEAELFTAARRLGLVVGIVIALATLVTVILFYAVLRRLVLSPVAALTGAVQDIARGRLLIDVPVRTRDEMGALARAFEDMGRDLHDAQRQVAARTVELEAARDRAEDANRAKSQFLATMSHEIRTPINGVLGMAELLDASDLTERQRHFLRSIRISGTALLSVVNDILDVSKIEAGNLEIARAPFGLRAMVSRLDDMVRPQAQEKGLTYHAHVADGIHDSFIGDADRLQQILLNLAGNALKFTDRGSVTVRVGCEQEDAHSAVLTFEVEDTGIGIAAEDRERIFEAFMQVDGSYTRRFGGTGLGLAICRRLVTLMGGALGVDSDRGRGSIFWVRLTLEKTEAVPRPVRLGLPQAETPQPLRGFRPRGEPLADKPWHAASFSPPAAREMRILVVDDDPISLEIVELMLLALGCDVETAGSGAEALSKMADRRVDMVLLDCSMPEMDGLETTRRLRLHERRTGAAHTIVVAATANAFDEDRRRCLEAGMDDYLSKPFGTAELMQMIDKWRPTLADGDPARAAIAAGPPATRK